MQDLEDQDSILGRGPVRAEITAAAAAGAAEEDEGSPAGHILLTLNGQTPTGSTGRGPGTPDSDSSSGSVAKSMRIDIPLETEKESMGPPVLMVPTTPFTARSTRTTAIHRAVRKQDLASLEDALALAPTEVNVQDEHGFVPLMNAAAMPDASVAVPILERLLALPECSTAICDKDGFTCMHWAAACGDADSMRLLVSRGASLNAIARKGGDTPLHRAARLARVDNVAALLQDLGAERRMLNKDYETAFDVVGRHSHPKACEEDVTMVRGLFLAADPSLRLLVLQHPECKDHETAEGHQASSRSILVLLPSFHLTMFCSSKFLYFHLACIISSFRSLLVGS